MNNEKAVVCGQDSTLARILKRLLVKQGFMVSNAHDVAASVVTGASVNTSRIPALLTIYGQGNQNIYLKAALPLRAHVATSRGRLAGRYSTARRRPTSWAVFHFDKQMGSKGSPSSVAWKPGTWSAHFRRQ